jgi:hypothetical protein
MTKTEIHRTIWKDKIIALVEINSDEDSKKNRKNNTMAYLPKGVPFPCSENLYQPMSHEYCTKRLSEIYHHIRLRLIIKHIMTK